jgi:hypothetical protein
LVAVESIGQNMSIAETTIDQVIPSPVTKVGRETYITVDDETKRLFKWARQYGISVEAILNRVKHGWDWETAITMPKRSYRSLKSKESDDETKHWRKL